MISSSTDLHRCNHPFAGIASNKVRHLQYVTRNLSPEMHVTLQSFGIAVLLTPPAYFSGRCCPTRLTMLPSGDGGEAVTMPNINHEFSQSILSEYVKQQVKSLIHAAIRS
jgi:hypothetical protein